MSSTDTLTYELEQSSSSEPNLFLRKEWLKVNDNNQSYDARQSVISTSQISANRYINYTEGYLEIPILLSMSSPAGTINANCDYTLGLKTFSIM